MSSWPHPVPGWYYHWEKWVVGGRRGVRPKDAPIKVPKWAWDLFHYRAPLHHPKPPPPPPPPVPPPPPAEPVSRWRDAPWTKKHVHISHGLRDNDGVWTVDQLIGRAQAAGCRAIIAQIGGDCPDPDWARHTRELYQRGRAAGLQIGAWGRVDYVGWAEVESMIAQVLPLDGFLADVEGRCSDQQLPEHVVARFPGLRLGMIATGAIDQAIDGLSPPEVAARFGDYFDFVGQDYHKADLPLTPDTMENFVYWRSAAKIKGGFRRLPDAGNRYHVPVVMPNAETCPPMEAHRPWLAAWTPHYGVWDGELLESAGEWGVFASI